MIEAATFHVDEDDESALANIVLQLTAVGYSEANVCERLGLAGMDKLLWRAQPVYRQEFLAKREKLDLAIDLFLLQGNITAEELNQLFDESEQEVLVRTGLLLIDNDKCFARASLYPVDNRLIFSDHAWPKLPHPGCLNVSYDQVMYIGADSRWLAHATVRKPVNSALDLCAGSGIHAILAASHSQRVVAVDISPRAAKCTSFNAKASGLTNIEVAVGDLYEPIGYERFELITANPPFVPSPINSLGYRDGGQSGEDVQRRIIQGLPRHLAHGGIAQIVTELGEREDESLAERLRIWLNGAPMDILILRLREHTAVNYAIGHANADDTYGAFLDSVLDWSNNLKAQGYTKIVSVLLTFAWSDTTLGEPWTREEELEPPQGDAGAEIEAMFYSERLSRHPNLFDILEQNKMYAAKSIGLMEANVLGSELRTNTQAKLLGRSLCISRWLEPLKREVLLMLEKQPLTLPELLLLTRGLNLKNETVFAAVGSLIQSGFVHL